MECTSCAPVEGVVQRADKPHTFLHHEPSHCEKCRQDVEARVVIRKGEIWALKFCPTCGQTEAKVADSADAYLDAWVKRGEVVDDERDHLFKHTTSTCPQCLALLQAEVVIRKGKVYFKKNCRKCGPSEALVSEDARYYVRAYTFARAGTEPLKFAAEVKHGCPTDCGTCGDHEQHTCLPIVEVTDHCNLECPICIVNNQDSNHIELAAFQRIVDQMVER